MRELEREPNPTLAIVGAGRMGTVIHRAAVAGGLEARLCDRDGLAPGCDRVEIVLLCVPDTAIGEACAAVCETGAGTAFVGHTSGATGLGALATASAIGAATFSLHPLQTIPDGDADLGGAACAISASSPEAAERARHLAGALRMRPFEISEEHRAAYHAAAAIASNFLVTIEESAAELMRRAGVDEPREALAPLVLRSAANWSQRGRGALTGPIARGDEVTVARHLEALAELQPELLDLYRALAERTRAIAATGAPA